MKDPIFVRIFVDPLIDYTKGINHIGSTVVFHSKLNYEYTGGGTRDYEGEQISYTFHKKLDAYPYPYFNYESQLHAFNKLKGMI